MDPSNYIYYPNSLCFDDKSKVEMFSNTNYAEFKQIFFSIDACHPDLYDGTCKSDEEISEFVANN